MSEGQLVDVLCKLLTTGHVTDEERAALISARYVIFDTSTLRAIGSSGIVALAKAVMALRSRVAELEKARRPFQLGDTVRTTKPGAEACYLERGRSWGQVGKVEEISGGFDTFVVNGGHYTADELELVEPAR